jgi:magnesium transporter
VPITCRVYRDGTLEEEVPFAPEVVEAADRDGARVWLDAIDPTEQELASIQATLGLHALAVEDTQNWGQRSKVEFYAEADHLFLVVHGLRLDEADTLVDSEVHLFAGRAFYVATVRRSPVFDFHRAAERLQVERGLGGEGIGFLLYLLLDEIVDVYLDMVERLEEMSDDIEERVSQDDAGVSDDTLAQDIFRLRRTVVGFRRLAIPMREVVDLLLETPSVVTPPLMPYYRDVLDHVIRASELIDNVRDLLSSARELQLAQVSNRMNEVMKRVTSWGAIILVPTLIAGIYGMNFRHMPELSWQVGYPFALGTMVVTAFLLYRGFRKRDWL